MLTTTSTGLNQLATVAAVLPANPSRARIPAAVQLGTVATMPVNAPKNELPLFRVGAVLHSLAGFMLTPQTGTP
jgi:hypothetical protein